MTGNRVFFVLQALLKYLPFEWAAGLRGRLYRPFFRRVGVGFRVYDGVTIKYPSDIELGRHVRINEGCVVTGKGGLVIGDEVMIGAGSKITTSLHGTALGLPMQRQPMSVRPVRIGSDVWLGFDVKVLAGSQIGDGAVIAAGSVVPGKAIPAYAIAAGVPARVLRLRTDAAAGERLGGGAEDFDDALGRVS